MSNEEFVFKRLKKDGQKVGKEIKESINVENTILEDDFQFKRLGEQSKKRRGRPRKNETNKTNVKNIKPKKEEKPIINEANLEDTVLEQHENSSMSTVKQESIAYEAIFNKKQIKTKSIRREDIGKNIKNFDELLINCVNYLGNNSEIALKVLKAIKEGKIEPDEKQIEINRIKKKIKEYENEIEKWNRIYTEAKMENAINIDLDIEIKHNKIDEETILKTNKELKDELEREGDIIQLEEDKLISRFVQIEKKSTALTKSIFDADEEQIDPIILLKAMTKV